MRSVEFQVVDPATGDRSTLPDVETWTLSPISDGSGVIQITYPAAGVRFALLKAFVDDDRDATVICRIDGQETPSYTAIMAEAQGDTADPAAIWTFSGRFQAVFLDQAVIYPDPDAEVVTDDGGLDDASRSFGDLNAGQIFDPLIAEAQARGAAAAVTYASFDSATDSNGAAWTNTVTTSCSPGISILSLLNTLSTAGLMDWTMVGLDLRLYNPGTLGSDLTLSTPPVILQGPRDLTQAQRTFSAQNSVTSLLIAGAEGLYTTVSSSPAESRRGRVIEGYASSSNISDPGTLTAFGDATLALDAPGVLQVTHGLAMDGSGPMPFDDFDVNDWIWSDTGGGLERLQVAQWSVGMDANGILTGTVTLNNLVAARVVKLQRQINALTDGTTVVGTSTPSPPTPDEIAPEPPTGLDASSVAFVAPTGVTEAQITAAWVAPTLNVDSSPLTDLEGYNLQWAYASGQGLSTQWNAVPGAITSASASWSPVLPGVHVLVQVQAYDSSGNDSAWTGSYNVLTAQTATPPPEASTPVVAPYLGQLKITWDGLSSTAGPMPPDFSVCQVHISLTSGFTPSSATLIDLLSGAGESIATDLIYGDTYYVAFVTENFAALTGTPSAEATGVPVQAANGDVSDLSVGKLTAGVLSADVTVSGRFATSLTGARTEMNSSGFFQYASDGVTVLAEISNSAITIEGLFKTVGPDGSFIELGTAPGYAIIELLAGGGVLHNTLPGQIYGVVANVGTSTERVNMIITSGKESSNDDAAIQLFSEDASGATPAQANVEFGGAIIASFTRAGLSITTNGGGGGGFTGNPDLSQFDNTTDTNNDLGGAEPMTKQWPIPAGDAKVGTSYEIKINFSGVNGSAVQSYGFKPSLNGAAVTTSGGDVVGATALGLIGAGAGAGWTGWCLLTLRIKTVGASGTVDIFIEGAISGEANQQGGAAATAYPFGSQALAVAFDTTAANTIALDSIWGGANASETSTCPGSRFTRKGP